MYGMPPEAGGMGLDASMIMLTGYLLAGLVGLILFAIVLGLFTLPAFFVILYVADRVVSAFAALTGWFPFKLVLIMFRGLRRSMLRTSLTYLAIFVLTLVLCLIYAVLNMIGNATTEKEANFKAIVTHKTTIPSQMPAGYYDEFKRLCLEELPPDQRPVNGDKDIMSWSFVLGTTDKLNPRKDTMAFFFALEPDKVLTMMDGLDELTGEERRLLEAACEAMKNNKQAVVMSRSRLRNLNKQVGDEIQVHGINYPDILFKFTIIGELPEGKYEGIAFMSKDYLVSELEGYVSKDGKKGHPMLDKCINLIWVRLPNKESFESLSAMLDANYKPPAGKTKPKFDKQPIKLETASSGIGTWLGAFKDIFWGIKYILVPAMIGIMSLVVANALSISVRERRTEMAVLKVLGFQPRHVLLLVLGEAILVGFMGGLMSSLLAWQMLGSFKFQIMFFGAFIVPAKALIYAPLLGTAVAFGGSLIPALTAKNVKVAEVFAKVA
jgi:putative ABC transport system permease protein